MSRLPLLTIINGHRTRRADINHSPANILATHGMTDTTAPVQFAQLAEFCKGDRARNGHVLVTGSPALVYKLTDNHGGNDRQVCLAMFCANCGEVANVDGKHIEHQSRDS